MSLITRLFISAILTIGFILIVTPLESHAQSRPETRGDSKAQLLTKLNQWTEELQQVETTDSTSFEKDARLNWIYKLRLGVLSGYDGQDVQLLKIIERLADLQQETGSTDPLGPFLQNLLICIHEDRELTENFFLFIREFTEFGGILSPPKADEFIETREYRGQGYSEPASPLDLEEASDILLDAEVLEDP